MASPSAASKNGEHGYTVRVFAEEQSAGAGVPRRLDVIAPVEKTPQAPVSISEEYVSWIEDTLRKTIVFRANDDMAG